MKQRKNRNGFTLVELLVVIAILAVLATVTTISYFAFTTRAKESNDISLTAQMNTVLQGNEATNKAKTIDEAVSQLQEGGLNIEKLTPMSSGYCYVWDSSINRIFLLNNEYNVVAPENINISSNKSDIFTFALTQDDVNKYCNLDYSIYVPSNAGLQNLEITDLTNISIAKESSVTTVNIVDNSSEGEFNISADLNDLTINAEKASINQYGEIGALDAIAVADHSLNIYGDVQYLSLNKGNLEVSGTVTTLNVSEPSGQIRVSNNDVGVINAIITSNGQLEGNENVSFSGINNNNTDFVTKDSINEDFSGGVGTIHSPYLISNEEELLKISDNAKERSAYYKIVSNFNLNSTLRLYGNNQSYLDFSNCTINFDAAGAIELYDESKLTISGDNGLFNLLESHNDGTMFYTSGSSTLNLLNGKYNSGLVVALADGSSTVNVYGGFYSAFATYADNYWILNLQDNTNAKINVYGGTFANYNPADVRTEPSITSFVGDGYQSIIQNELTDGYFECVVVPLN